MSNVKVNGNIYNNVENIQLMKADGSGYAKYTEGAAAAADFRDVLTAGGYTKIGDYENDGANVYIGWLEKCGGGTIAFPAATVAKGSVKYAKFDNLLLPHVASMNSASTASGDYPAPSVFTNTDVTGVLDLGSLASIQNGMNVFQNCNIGTLKLGALAYSNLFIGSATITNFIYDNPTTDLGNSNFVTNMNAATQITNLYVPADQLSAWQEKISNGTFTKITNVYSIDEWED